MKGKANKELYDKTVEHRGVGILLHHSLWKYIERIEPNGSRLMKMRLNLHKKLDIISTYAPPAVSNDKATTKEEKQEYYDALTDVVKETPNNNTLIVLGDMNARVIEATNKKEMQVIGKHTLVGSSKPNDLKEETTKDNFTFK